jgi:hypothetical protein
MIPVRHHPFLGMDPAAIVFGRARNSGKKQSSIATAAGQVPFQVGEIDSLILHRRLPVGNSAPVARALLGLSVG